MNKPLFPALLCLSILCADAQDAPVELPAVEVSTSSSSIPSTNLPMSSGAGTVTDALEQLPGLQMRRLGACGNEPVIRGLGWERVQTRFNGLPLYGACPSRMDPPVNLFSLENLDAVEVLMGPASVIEGPPGIGGAVNLSTRLETSDTPMILTSLGAGVESQGNVWNVQGGVEGATERNAWRINAATGGRDDYTAGDGTKVPAGSQHEEATVNVLQAFGNGHSFHLGGHWKHETDTDYVALPMDSRYVKNLIGTAEWIWETDGEVLRGLELRGGVSDTEHLMDNRDKPNRRMLEASTPSEADSASVRFLSRWALGEGEFRFGADASQLERDATRTRFVKANGMTFKDPIWPGMEQDQSALFAEWETPEASEWSLRAGLRSDWVETDATRADERIVPGPAYGPTTVAETYVDVGGSDGTIAQDDQLWSGTLQIGRDVSEAWRVNLALGHIESAPNLTQRYRAFGPEPGGFGLGTPSLDPETKQEIELRAEGTVHTHRLGIALYAARIDDFLYPTTLTMLDVNGDGRIDRVRGHENRDVERWGMEAEAILTASETLQVPLKMEFVRAETTDGTPVPETPPLELHGALQWSPASEWNPVAELGLRYVHKQDQIDPAFGEDATPSFALVHVRVQFQPVENWWVEAGIENLLDRTYHEHLTREALLPVGDLQAGDEVPGPGRSFTLAVRTRW